MRICRVVSSFPSLEGIKGPAGGYLGPNVYCISLAQVSLGDEVTVVTGIEKHLPENEDIQGIRIRRVNRPFNLKAARRILALHREDPFDVIHVHAANCFSAAFLRKISREVMLVSHVHGTTAGSSASCTISTHDGDSKNTLLRERLQWKGSDAVFAVSRATSSEVVHCYGVDPDRVHTAYNGVDLDLFQPVRELDDELMRLFGFDPYSDQIALYVGQIGPRKGLEDMAAAADLVFREREDVIFALAGGAPGYAGEKGMRYFDNIKKKFGNRRFIFLGPIPHFRLPQLYSIADVFVFSTLYEGFPKAMLEAMACEKPVVSTSVGGIPEMIEQGIEGLLVEPRQPDRFASAVCDILEDRAGALRMGRRSRQRVRRYFTWEKTARKLREVYESTEKNLFIS